MAVDGDALDLCTHVAAEVKGWPCAALLVLPTPPEFLDASTASRDRRSNAAAPAPAVAVTARAERVGPVLAIRVAPPVFNGRVLPASEVGGPRAAGWRPLILACGGDFTSVG